MGGGLSYRIFELQDKWTKDGVRPTRDDEITGLDPPEMGVPAYSLTDFTPIDAEIEEITVPSRASAVAGDGCP